MSRVPPVMVGVPLRNSDGTAAWRQIEAFLACAIGAVVASLLYRTNFGLLVWVAMAAAIMALICFEMMPAPKDRPDS